MNASEPQLALMNYLMFLNCPGINFCTAENRLWQENKAYTEASSTFWDFVPVAIAIFLFPGPSTKMSNLIVILSATQR